MLRRKEGTSVSVGVGFSKKSCRNYDIPKHKHRFLKEESLIHVTFLNNSHTLGSNSDNRIE